MASHQSRSLRPLLDPGALPLPPGAQAHSELIFLRRDATSLGLGLDRAPRGRSMVWAIGLSHLPARTGGALQTRRPTWPSTRVMQPVAPRKPSFGCPIATPSGNVMKGRSRITADYPTRCPPNLGMVQKRVPAKRGGWGRRPKGNAPRSEAAALGGSLAAATRSQPPNSSSPARLAERVVPPHAPMTLGANHVSRASKGRDPALLVISGLATHGDGLRFLSRALTTPRSALGGVLSV